MARMRTLTMLRRFAPKAKQMAEQNAGTIAENVNKATAFVDERTGGKYADKLGKVDAKANEFARKQGQAPADPDTRDTRDAPDAPDAPDAHDERGDDGTTS